jgi:hypothetical protein
MAVDRWRLLGAIAMLDLRTQAEAPEALRQQRLSKEPFNGCDWRTLAQSLRVKNATRNRIEPTEDSTGSRSPQ